MLTRAYATLDIKSVDLATREIEGIATTCATDHAGDCVESSGAQFSLPLPLLWQHDQSRPVGEVYEARIEPAGIRIKARFATVDEPGTLRDRLDEAWQSVKARLVRGLSIGFKPLDAVPLKSGGMHVKRWLWAELSAVTADLMTKAAETGVTLAADQAETYDAQETRVKSIDADLARVRSLEAFNVTRATPVPASPITPRPAVVQVKANVPKGTAFVRMACAKLVCNGNMYEAAEYAKRWNDSTPEVSLYLKAAVAPGTTTDATWAQPLVNQNIATDFLELLRPATILGKIPGLRNVPFNTKVPAQTAGGTYGWVGEQKPKPVTKLAFSSVSLGVNKIAGIIVLTEELVRLSNPKAEDVVRRDMIAGIAQFMDAQFIDPAVAAVAGVNPASITNGAPTAAATANPLADIMSLIAHFTTNNIPVDGLSFIMSPGNALSLSFRTTVSGDAMFPGITTDGGSYRGINFVTSNAAGTNVIAVQPAYVLYADDGGVTIDASREASLQMDSAPTSPVDATTVMVSLWQANCVGLRAERFVTWNKINANAVKYLTAAAYPAPSGALEVQEAPAATRNGKREA
jgi:HK97 family phage major capsid protein